MIPRLRPQLGRDEFAAALVGRYNVRDFERAFAALMQQRHAVAFSYGRTALLTLLRALDVSNCEVICPSYTCVVVAHAIVLSGNTPVFVDSEEGGFNMDLEKAAAAITPRTKVIIATSIHGYPVNLDKLEEIEREHPGVFIIQDCAHSFAASWRGRPVQKAGVAAVYGLNVSKLMTSIFGGMITTDDPALAARLEEERSSLKENGSAKALSRLLYLFAASAALHPTAFSLIDRLRRAKLLDRFTEYYDEAVIDMPTDYLRQLSRPEASVGVVQCRRYPHIIAHRRKIAALYDDQLRGYDGITPPPLVDGATYSHYVPLVNNPETVVHALWAAGIEAGRLIDYCIPDMPAYRGMVQPGAHFERTRELNRSVLNLPIWVDEGTAARIARQTKEVVRETS